MYVIIGGAELSRGRRLDRACVTLQSLPLPVCKPSTSRKRATTHCNSARRLRHEPPAIAAEFVCFHDDYCRPGLLAETRATETRVFNRDSLKPRAGNQ